MLAFLFFRKYFSRGLPSDISDSERNNADFLQWPAAHHSFDDTDDTTDNINMQVNGVVLRRRQDPALQLGSSCGFPPGTALRIQPSLIQSGFLSATGEKMTIFNPSTIRFPNGMTFKNDMGGAVALAEHEGCDINLQQYYLQLNGGEEALRIANDIGLPAGFVVNYKTNDDGVIEGVRIWTPKGDFYANYYHLASLGIDTAALSCPYWLGKRQEAVAHHFPNDGWAILSSTRSAFKKIYSPNGDTYTSMVDAYVVAGVILPIETLLGLVRGHITIVRELDGSYTHTAIANFVGIRRNTFSRALSVGSATPATFYQINLFFTNANSRREAARAAGVEDIVEYDCRMTSTMDSLALREVVPPEPLIRAQEPTNEYAGLVNGRVVVGGANDQDPPQIQADLPLPILEVEVEEYVNFAQV